MSYKYTHFFCGFAAVMWVISYGYSGEAWDLAVALGMGVLFVITTEKPSE